LSLTLALTLALTLTPTPAPTPTRTRTRTPDSLPPPSALFFPATLSLDIVNNASFRSLIFGPSRPTRILNRWKAQHLVSDSLIPFRLTDRALRIGCPVSDLEK
jgi:hypothetical protein